MNELLGGGWDQPCLLPSETLLPALAVDQVKYMSHFLTAQSIQ